MSINSGDNSCGDADRVNVYLKTLQRKYPQIDGNELSVLEANKIREQLLYESIEKEMVSLRLIGDSEEASHSTFPTQTPINPQDRKVRKLNRQIECIKLENKSIRLLLDFKRMKVKNDQLRESRQSQSITMTFIPEAADHTHEFDDEVITHQSSRPGKDDDYSCGPDFSTIASSVHTATPGIKYKSHQTANNSTPISRHDAHLFPLPNVNNLSNSVSARGGHTRNDRNMEFTDFSGDLESIDWTSEPTRQNMKENKEFIHSGSLASLHANSIRFASGERYDNCSDVEDRDDMSLGTRSGSKFIKKSVSLLTNNSHQTKRDVSDDNDDVRVFAPPIDHKDDDDLASDDGMLTANVTYSSTTDIVSSLNLWATNKDYFKEADDTDDTDMTSPAKQREIERKISIAKEEKTKLALAAAKEKKRMSQLTKQELIAEQIQRLKTIGWVNKQRLIVAQARAEAERQAILSAKTRQVEEVKKQVADVIVRVNSLKIEAGFQHSTDVSTTSCLMENSSSSSSSSSSSLSTDIFTPDESKSSHTIISSDDSEIVRPSDCCGGFDSPLAIIIYPRVDWCAESTLTLDVSIADIHIIRLPRRRQFVHHMKFFITISETGDWYDEVIDDQKMCFDEDSLIDPLNDDDGGGDDDIGNNNNNDNASSRLGGGPLQSTRSSFISGFVLDYAPVSTFDDEDVSSHVDLSFHDDDVASALTSDFKHHLYHDEDFEHEGDRDYESNGVMMNDHRCVEENDNNSYYPNEYRGGGGDVYVDSTSHGSIGGRMMLPYDSGMQACRTYQGPHESEAPGELGLSEFYDDDISSDDEEDNLFNDELHDASASLVSNITFDTALLQRCSPSHHTREVFESEFGMILNAAEKERCCYLNDLDIAQDSPWNKNSSEILDLFSIVEEGDEISQRKREEMELFLSTTVLTRAREHDFNFRKQHRSYIQTIQSLDRDSILDDISALNVNKGKTKLNRMHEKLYLNSNKWVKGTACRKRSLKYTGIPDEIPGQTSMQCFENVARFDKEEETEMDMFINFNGERCDWSSACVRPDWD